MALLLVDYGWGIVVIGYSHARIIKPGVLQVKLLQLQRVRDIFDTVRVPGAPSPAGF